MSKSAPLLILTLAFATLLQAADEPALDAAKYPQDTPKNTLVSIIKALEGKDYAYYVSHMVLPADKERAIKKYGSVEKYAAAKNEDTQAAAMKSMLDVMKSLQQKGKESEGETAGVKWTRFEADKNRLQLEKQADGRWAMNLRPPGDAVKDAPKKDAPAQK